MRNIIVVQCKECIRDTTINKVWLFRVSYRLKVKEEIGILTICARCSFFDKFKHDKMVLLSKLFNSIRGALTPRPKKRSREEMSASDLNEVRRETTLGEGPGPKSMAENLGKYTHGNNPSHSRIKNARIEKPPGGTHLHHNDDRPSVNLLSSVDVLKRSGGEAFVWKQFPAPSPTVVRTPRKSFNGKRDDIPDHMIGSALRKEGSGPHCNLTLEGEMLTSRVRPFGNVKSLSKDMDATKKISKCDVDEAEDTCPTLRPGNLMLHSPRSESVTHAQFYSRFLNRMHSLISEKLDKMDSSTMLLSESPKDSYEFHRERIQKLTSRANALLDYREAEKRQIELKEIEDNINKIRELRIKPRSDVEYTRVIPLPQITDSDRQRYLDLVSREPDEVVLRHEPSKVRLMGNDLARLNCGCWLNDEIINLYMRLLQERDTRLHAAGGMETYPKCHFFNSFFLTKLYKDTGKYDYESVRRWTAPGRLKAIGQSRTSILDCDKILVPVNQGNVHWVTAVIDIKNKKFEYFDSLRGEDSTCLNHLSQYLMDEYKNKRNEERPDILKWPRVYPKSIPEQVNGYDCGIFLILFADYLSKSAKLNFSQKDIENFRVKLALDFAGMEVA